MNSTTLHRGTVVLAVLAALTLVVGLLVWPSTSARAEGPATSGSTTVPAGTVEIGTAVAYVMDDDGTVHPYDH